MRHLIILAVLFLTVNSRSIFDERAKGSYFVESTDHTNDGLFLLSPAAELPKIPLRIISNSEVPEDSREKSSSLGDDLILDTDSDSDDVNERPLFDEFGTIITYPDKQLAHTDISEQQKEIRRFEEKSQDFVQESDRSPDCIPRNYQDDGIPENESAEENALKEAANELLSPVSTGLEADQREKASSNFTGPEIIEEPFIKITVQPLCPY